MIVLVGWREGHPADKKEPVQWCNLSPKMRRRESRVWTIWPRFTWNVAVEPEWVSSFLTASAHYRPFSAIVLNRKRRMPMFVTGRLGGSIVTVRWSWAIALLCSTFSGVRMRTTSSQVARKTVPSRSGRFPRADCWEIWRSRSSTWWHISDVLDLLCGIPPYTTYCSVVVCHPSLNLDLYISPLFV